MPVTLQRAGELFNLANAQLCCPGNPQSPCIPFLYPDDGCWARAHEMCRLMIAAGDRPEKIWIYGGLKVATGNHPNCKVTWGWHVAPILRVSTAGGNTEVYVIDPSLFTAPVTQATWVGVQGDPSPTVVHTAADVFHRTFGGKVTYDANYSQTQSTLSLYRDKLRLRAVSPDGPPPYVQCITKGPGVQWFGLLEPGQTKRWFTYGWPASRHVVWTIVPLTPCPHGPQLSWTTQVERASATECTYWITVKNLIPAPVRFEGRYDVLKW